MADQQSEYKGQKPSEKIQHPSGEVRKDRPITGSEFEKGARPAPPPPVIRKK